jgi:tetratricopeptide (TPR) repeat protein
MFEKKIGCDPKSLSAYINAAACYYQSKNYPRMRELLFKGIALKSDFLQARLWLGRYYAQVDSLDQAKQEYEEVIRIIGPNTEKNKRETGEAYQQLGQTFFLRKQYDRCADACRKSLAVGSENSPLHLMWGQAILQMLDPNADPADNQKKKEEASRHFRRSAELDPGNALAHFWLGQALVILRVEGDNEGNKRLQEEACSEWRKVLRIDPRNEDAKKSMDRYGCGK